MPNNLLLCKSRLCKAVVEVTAVQLEAVMAFDASDSDLPVTITSPHGFDSAVTVPPSWQFSHSNSQTITLLLLEFEVPELG